MAPPQSPRQPSPSYEGFIPSSPAASRVKRKNRREGGRAERLLRSALWQRGLRYRVHIWQLPGCPDLVFSRARAVVFVDGDFWHGRDWATLLARLERRANPEYWVPKIARNIERDQAQTQLLEQLGWRVLRLWETDVLADVEVAAGRVTDFLQSGAPVAHPN